MKVIARITAGLASTALVGAALATAAPAQAANAYSAQSVCGSGFRAVGAPAYPQHIGGVRGIPGATVHLLYKASTQENCAVLLRDETARATMMTIDVYRADGWSPKLGYEDVGIYRYYAGPVKFKAPGQCVKVYGSIYGYNSVDFYNNESNYRTAGWSACG